MTAATARHRWRFREQSIVPGFGMTFGFTVSYLCLIILISRLPPSV